MEGVALAHHQRAPAFALVVDMGDFPLGVHRPFHRDGIVEDQLLFAVQHPGQVDVGLQTDLHENIEDGCDGKTRNDLQILFIAVVQVGKTGADPQGIQHNVLPCVVLGQGGEGLAHRVKIQGHDFLLWCSSALKGCRKAANAGRRF